MNEKVAYKDFKRPVVPFYVIVSLDSADVNDILDSVVDLPEKGSAEYWIYRHSLLFMLGLETYAPVGFTLDIAGSISLAVAEWKVQNGLS